MQSQTVAVLNQFHETPILYPLVNWISNRNTDINKQPKLNITKMIDRKNIHSVMAE